MTTRVLALAVLLTACATPPSFSTGREIVLTPAQARVIGERIFQNEAGGKTENLTFWNANEDFPSMGIGHFLWYVPGRRSDYKETFPQLLDFLAANGIRLPSWLRGSPRPGCPWNDRAAFYADINGSRLAGLRRILADTIGLQAQFIANRLRASLAPILAAAPAADRQLLEDRFYAVAATPEGVYALADYVNFKGEGATPSECVGHRDVCWGLLQALHNMTGAPGRAAVDDFADGADLALKQRVCASAADRRQFEEGWLRGGWHTRVHGYRGGNAPPPPVENPLVCGTPAPYPPVTPARP